MLGWGLTDYLIPLIYGLGWLAAFCALFVNPRIGIFFLFPLFPYQNVFERIKVYPFGKDFNDIIVLAILIGWFIRKGMTGQNKEKEYKLKTIGLNIPVILIVISTTIGFLISTFKFGASFDFNNTFLLNWKNYMLFPLMWFLTAENIKEKKDIKILIILMIIGILGADYYFRNNMRWMHLWHYSDKAKDLMTGLFVYLGGESLWGFLCSFLLPACRFIVFYQVEKAKDYSIDNFFFHRLLRYVYIFPRCLFCYFGRIIVPGTC